MKKKLLLSSLVVFVLILSACTTATPTAPAATMAPTTAATMAETMAPTTAETMAATTAATMAATTAATMASGPAEVDAGQNATLGSFLVDSKGFTLYLYTKDTPNTSTCYGGCAAAWPPLLTTGAPTAGTGVTASMLGTTTRTDGTTQVTYNGWPLYYFAKDMAAGDTTGENVQGVWFVITPAGAQK